MRLYLRKDTWIRQANIGYEHDVEDVAKACDVLCQRIVFTPSPPTTPFKEDNGRFADAGKTLKEESSGGVPNDPDVIDLTGDDDDDDEDSSNTDPYRLNGGLRTHDDEGDLSILALDQKALVEESPETVLNLLSAEELVGLGKRMKVNPGRGTRRDWTQALLKTNNQSMLSFVPVGGSVSPPSANARRGRADKENSADIKPVGAFGLSFDSKGNTMKASTVASRQALKTIGGFNAPRPTDGSQQLLTAVESKPGPVIRLNPAYRRLFDRLSLVYHRTTYTANNTTSFVASLLARFGKRHYPTYRVSRTFAIFPSRQQLTQYERALDVERRIEDILGENPATWAPALPAGAKRPFKTAEEKRADKDKMCAEGVKLFEAVEDAWTRLCRDAEREMKKEEDDDERRLLYYRRRFHPGALVVCALRSRCEADCCV